MPEIHADMTMEDILEMKPVAKDIFFEYGILSENEVIRSMETVGEACVAHGLDEEVIEKLIEKLELL